MTDGSSPALFEHRRWGIAPEAILEPGERLHGFRQRYRGCFQTTTRDAGACAYSYVSPLRRMDAERNFANIGPPVGLRGQNVQHLMTNSPWSAPGVLRQVRQEITARPEPRQGGVLVLGESAVEKAGHTSAGVGRQWNGQPRTVDQSQVGTFLAYTNGPVWNLNRR